MRVKKLNANRRHKSGDDETAIGDSEQRKWVSPTKPAATTGSSSGASSPSDPSSVHPLHAAGLQQQQQQQQQTNLGENSPPQFRTNNSEVFARGPVGGGGVVQLPVMPKNNGMPLMMASRPGDSAAKPASADWHEVVDRTTREAVHAKIVEILRSLKPNAPEKVLERLPGLAYRMEESLFKLAASEAEYCDASTLAQRIAGIQENNAKRLLTQQQQQQQSAKSLKQTNNSNGMSPSGSNGADAVAAMQTRKPLAEEQARVVFQCLQTWRQKLVNMYGVAPWEILPNQTLAKVSVYVPTTEQELAMCGVQEELLARFGSSLVQELRRVCDGIGAVQPGIKSAKSSKPGRKAESGKRAADSLATGSNKKRKSGPASTGTGARLAPAAPSFSGTSLMSPSQLMFRQSVGVESLPTLLPPASMASAGATATSSSMSSTAAGKKSPFAAAATAARLSPASQVIQQPFFMRQQSQSQPQQQAAGNSPAAQENHMHLLAQSAGQVSKQQQQQAKSVELYEQEVQSLRWLLHQSQQEKAQLESEVQRLRAQLQGSK